VKLSAYGLEDRNLLIRVFQTAYMNSLFPDTQRPSPESAGADVAVPWREDLRYASTPPAVSRAFADTLVAPANERLRRGGPPEAAPSPSGRPPCGVWTKTVRGVDNGMSAARNRFRMANRSSLLVSGAILGLLTCPVTVSVMPSGVN